MALLTAAEVQTWLPQTAGDSATVLAQAIAAAEGRADGHVGYSLESASVDQYFDTIAWETELVLSAFPVTAIEAVTETPNTAASVLTVTTNYVANMASGILRRVSTTWATGTRAVRVQYTAGYTTSTLPDALKDILLDLVAWRLAARGDVGTKTDALDGYSRTKEETVRGLPASIAAALNQYRR